MSLTIFFPALVAFVVFSPSPVVGNCECSDITSRSVVTGEIEGYCITQDPDTKRNWCYVKYINECKDRRVSNLHGGLYWSYDGCDALRRAAGPKVSRG